MQKEGAAQYPKEACGLIIKRGKKTVAIPCENISTEPEEHFLMSPESYAEAADKGEVIGVWHTHPDKSSKPSEADLAGCEASELVWVIMGVVQDENGGFRYEKPEAIEPAGFELPYLERPYVFGVVDCYTLVQDYYKREYGIKLIEAPRVEEWWLQGHNFVEDLFEEIGFIRVKDAPQKGDIFLMQIGADVANHMAIYMGDDTVLHHCHGRLSTRDIYGGYWQKHTTFHLRYKDFV
ncbi:C40 family peptidase [Oxalobacter sp. OttesenSCG-928-P03]|nr:C40 family peptidase [Oxalobacter sp. OttesenSCG-928-P03]